MARIPGCEASSSISRERILQFAARRIVRRVVGVDRHGAEQPRVQVDGLHGEPGGFKVAANLHGTLDAHCLGGVQGAAERLR